MAAEATGIGADAIAALLARVTVYLSLAGFVVGVALTSRIHRSFGIAAALLLLPIGLGASATLILLTGALWAVAGARVMDTTLRYSVDKTTREVLFLPLPADLRFRAKPFIDVTMDRFAKAVAAVLILVLIHPQGIRPRLAATELRQPVRHGGMGRGGAHRLAGIPPRVPRQHRVARHRAREHSYRTSPMRRRSRRSSRSCRVPTSAPSSTPSICSRHWTGRNLVTPLLLQHESPRVRAQHAARHRRIGSPIASRWIPTIERMVQDEDVDVRAAALHALAAFSHEDAARASSPAPRRCRATGRR